MDRRTRRADGGLGLLRDRGVEGAGVDGGGDGQGGIALFVVRVGGDSWRATTPREWVGIGAIVFGMLLLALSLGGGETEGAFEPATLLMFTALLTLIGLAPMAVARMNASGAAAAIFSGIAFGLGGLFTKAMTFALAGDNGSLALRIVSCPYVYSVVAANIIGIVMLQNSFHSSRAIIAMPLSGALSNIVPIIGGMIVFGERLPAGSMPAAMRVGAFALTIVAGALLAGSRDQLPGDPVVVGSLSRVKPKSSLSAPVVPARRRDHGKSSPCDLDRRCCLP